MDKDKELLLPIADSDSDEVVEEFKLPSPRARRPRTRKAVSEARISASGYSVLSWKCCLLFLLATIVITGVLVLAFFMLSMQSEINELRRKSEKADGQLQHQASLEISSNKMMAEIEDCKEQISNQDLNNKLLVRQIAQLNKTVRLLSSAKSLPHTISLLKKDLDSLKSGMADTGADISKMQAQLHDHTIKIDSILTELKNLKVALYNSSVKNSTEMEKLTRPISAQTQVSFQEISKLKDMILSINRTDEKYIRKLATELYRNSVKDDTDLVSLNSAIRSLNQTYLEGLSTMKKYVFTTINETNIHLNDISSSTFIEISNLKNVSEELQHKTLHHHQILKNFTNLLSDINLTRITSLSNQIEILKLKNKSKLFEDEVTHHHELLQKRVLKMDSEKSTSIPPVSIASTSMANLASLQNEVTTEINENDETCIQPCSIGEECKETILGYACICKKGFVKEAKFCTDVDECQSSNVCHVNAICTNTFGSYNCICKEDFQGNGTHCYRSAQPLGTNNSMLNTSESKLLAGKNVNWTSFINATTSQPSADATDKSISSNVSLNPNTFDNSSLHSNLSSNLSNVTESNNASIRTDAVGNATFQELNTTNGGKTINSESDKGSGNSTINHEKNINSSKTIQSKGAINDAFSIVTDKPPHKTSENEMIDSEVHIINEIYTDTVSTTPSLTPELPDERGMYSTGNEIRGGVDNQLTNVKKDQENYVQLPLLNAVNDSQDSDMSDLNSVGNLGA